MIPKVLHFTYKNELMLNQHQSYLDSAQRINKGWQINLYDDETARNIVKEHFDEYLQMFDNFKHAVQRADVFRLMIMYLKGGFYADLDMEFLKPLYDLTTHQLILAEEKTLSAEECNRLKHLYPMRIANYMFGSEAYHPFWLDVLKAIRFQNNLTVKNENDILQHTGPGLFTNIFHQFKNKYPEIYLLENKTNRCLKNCNPKISCHFGDYARHWHQGSWRWQNKSTNLQE